MASMNSALAEVVAKAGVQTKVVDYFSEQWPHIDEVPGFSELPSDIEKFEKVWSSPP